MATLLKIFDIPAREYLYVHDTGENLMAVESVTFNFNFLILHDRKKFAVKTTNTKPHFRNKSLIINDDGHI